MLTGLRLDSAVRAADSAWLKSAFYGRSHRACQRSELDNSRQDGNTDTKHRSKANREVEPHVVQCGAKNAPNPRHLLPQRGDRTIKIVTNGSN